MHAKSFALLISMVKYLLRNHTILFNFHMCPLSVGFNYKFTYKSATYTIFLRKLHMKCLCIKYNIRNICNFLSAI